MAKEEIISFLKENSDLGNKIVSFADRIEEASNIVIKSLRNGNKILLAGNGGSATMASHIAAEFVGRYRKERKALPSIALTTDIAALTAISNDYGYDTVFSRQIEALAKPGDALITLTTSGNSQNLINAVHAAKKLSVNTISLSGKDGGKMKGMADMEIIVPSNNTPKIQEMHLLILHSICELAEEKIFGN
ncbi:D-sedoheptulose 7-phosphate isomerase [Candidatus Woesearchaeota archaeon]|nr:D-sedoheptulose 7-phosphate isomerase [Candidatus Woesearchaeota archaeon]